MADAESRPGSFTAYVGTISYRLSDRDFADFVRTGAQSNDLPYFVERLGILQARLEEVKVHAILQESPRKRAARTRADTPALLKGLLFGPDGAAFSPTHTRKGVKLYRYYVSQTVLKHGAGSCPVGRVPAGEIEATVIDQLRAVFRQPEIVAGTWKAARAQIGDITEADARAALQQLDPLWAELFPAEQARIVTLLVERVDIGTDGLNVRLRMDGLGGLAREMLAGRMGTAA
jgi:site-specific DNA recombinase